MVSAGVSGVLRFDKRKSFILRLPLDSHSNGQLGYDEIDFSDIFGPAVDSTENSQGILCLKDPQTINRRSHSLVGPSLELNLGGQLSKLALNNKEQGVEGNLLEKPECVDEGSHVASDNRLLLFSSGSSKEPKSFQVKVTQKLGVDDFELLKVVGQGAFGKVFQVKRNGTSEIYAMKVMRKDRILEKNHAEYTKAERDILTRIVHPFIVQLRYSFQTKYKLYLVMDFINGGHLFFQLQRQGLFSENLARVYVAEIICAVSYLHQNGIVHRDLKPENILLDSEGHVKLTDFGLAKEVEESGRSNSMCGTTEYMAPEIIQARGHNKAVDWWSVGILLYEMLTGQPPFSGHNRQKVQKKIIKDRIKLPPFLTSEAHSLLKGLLQKDPSKRLGSGASGSDDIKGHKWFKSISWKKLEARQIQPTFKPDVNGNCCIANFDGCWTTMPLDDHEPPSTPKADHDQHHFAGYSYVQSD